MTTKRASRGPALPIIDENAIKLDRAHLKPPVRVAMYPGESIIFVNHRLYNLF